MPDTRDDQAPLEGIRVLDFTKMVAGPKATMILADLGAEVIKVEGPGQEDPARFSGKTPGVTFTMANRNKKSISLDLSKPEGKAAARRLALTCDVVVEANRPGVMDRLGLGYEELAKAAPSLIYASVSGYGSTGPYAKRGGVDTILQAESGLMFNTGQPDGPPVLLGGYIIDESAGLTLSQSIILALYTRQKTGRGAHVEVSLLDTAVYLQSYEIAVASLSGAQAPRNGNKLANTAPGGVVTAQDAPMVLVALTDESFQRLCQVIGRPDLGADPRYATRKDRLAAHDLLLAEISSALSARPRAEWIALLEPEKLLVGAVRKYDEVLTDPQLRHNDSFVGASHLGKPLQLVRWPAQIAGQRFPATMVAPPALGVDTRTVLAAAGCDDAELARLEAAGAIAAPTS